MARQLFKAVFAVLLVVGSGCGGAEFGPPIPLGAVGPEGGTVSLAGGLVVLVVPPNAVTEYVTITLTDTTGPAGATVVPGTVVAIEPSLVFNVPVQVTIRYGSATLPAGVLEGELGLYKVVNGAWEKVATSTVDTASKTITALVGGFSIYGILGAPVAAVTVTPATVLLPTGATRTLSAEGKDGIGTVLPERTITWSTSLPGVAAVSSAGVVTGVSAGTATITAAVVTENRSGAATVTVGLVEVASVTVAPGIASLVVGATLQLTATPKDSTGAALPGRPVNWASSNAAVATVDGNGLVTGVAVGTDTITAMGEGGVRGAAIVVVGASGGPPVFQDDFETGARAAAQSGYQWKSSTSTVTVQSGAGYGGSTYGLRFQFGPDALTTTDDSDAEQRFQLGNYLSEVWFEYMLLAPANFVHRHISGDTDNNKFLLLWRDVYGSGGGDLAMGFEYNLLSGTTTTKLRPYSTTSGNATIHNIDSPQLNAVPFISPTGPIVPGTWAQIRIHFRAASGDSVFDGVMEMWVNGALVMQKTNGDFAYPPGPLHGQAPATFHNGYVLGWANSGFTDQTVFFVDNFKIYDVNPGW